MKRTLLMATFALLSMAGLRAEVHNNNITSVAFRLSVNSADDAMSSARIVKNVTCGTSEAIIEATANESYRFVRWSDGNTDNPRTLTVTEDMTLTAEFETKKHRPDGNNGWHTSMCGRRSCACNEHGRCIWRV